MIAICGVYCIRLTCARRRFVRLCTIFGRIYTTDDNDRRRRDLFTTCAKKKNRGEKGLSRRTHFCRTSVARATSAHTIYLDIRPPYIYIYKLYILYTAIHNIMKAPTLLSDSVICKLWFNKTLRNKNTFVYRSNHYYSWDSRKILDKKIYKILSQFIILGYVKFDRIKLYSPFD